MAAPIGPGDWVECVDASPGANDGLCLTRGGLYCIEAVDDRGLLCGTGRCGRTCRGVFLSGRRDRWPWCGSRFRPIYRPRADLIQTLLEPIKEDTRQPEHA